MRLPSTLLSSAAFVAIVAGGSMPAQAQIQPVDPVNAAGALPNLNVYQRDMGQSIDRVCPTLATARAAGLLTPVQADLALRCTEMVQTANEVLGRGGTQFSLGLTAEQTAMALGQIAGEEIQAPRTQIAEIRATQVQAIGGRMLALRQGVSGFGVVGIGGQGYAALPSQQLASLGTVEMAQQPDADTAARTAVPTRFGGFITGGLGFGDVDTTAFATGFDYDTYDVTIGVDYRVLPNAAVGVALGYSRFDADYEMTAGSKLESDTFVGSLYGTYFFDQFYIDGTLSYARGDYDSTRRIVYANIDRTATGNFNTDLYGASVTGGYTIPLGTMMGGGAQAGAGGGGMFAGAEATLLAGLDYVHAKIDSFTETGAEGLDLRYDSGDIDSLRSQLGVQLAMPISTGFGVIRPAVTARYIHEFMNDGLDTQVTYVNDPTGLSTFVITDQPVDRDYFNIGAQVSTQFAGGIAAFASYDTVLGLRDVSSHLFQIGLRMEF